MLGKSRDWIAGTREAADLIEMALVDERSGPVRLVRGDVADAVFHVLRFSSAKRSNLTSGPYARSVDPRLAIASDRRL